MNENFLIPANSKKSMLIFGLFRVFDLILFGGGLALTIILLLLLPVDSMVFAILALSPALITGFLVMPVPNYHNMLQVIRNLIDFFTTRQKYIWKGWCVLDAEKEDKK